MKTRVGIAGATGWAGSSLAKHILSSEEFQLTAAIARKTAGQDIGTALGRWPAGVVISSDLPNALTQPIDVLVDYTAPESLKARVIDALRSGVRVVIGTSGLSSADYDDIAAEATKAKLGVIGAGNFSITAALAKHFALIAARYLPSWEILDYAQANKPDAPSGTTRELAEELGLIAANQLGMAIPETYGSREARGAQIKGTPVHSIRLPSYVLAFETIFGRPGERLSIRHDAGTGAEPYVAGTLLAIQEVMSVTGLVRGLDRLIFRQAE